MTDTLREGDFEIVILRSGAHAVRHLGHGEVMHPAEGPWTEARKLYVDQLDLRGRLARGGDPVRILDVGLGAATNAVAALTCAREHGGRVAINSFEMDLAPLRLALRDTEGFPFLSPFADAARALVEHGAWEGPEGSWTLHRGDLLDRIASAPGEAELVLFDPFSPEHNASLWTPAAFASVRARCRTTDGGALLATYSASTSVRTSLLCAGFFVGAGVSTGGKRETTVASTVLASLAAPLGDRWLARWERSSARAPYGEGVLTAERERQIRSHPQLERRPG